MLTHDRTSLACRNILLAVHSLKFDNGVGYGRACGSADSFSRVQPRCWYSKTRRTATERMGNTARILLHSVGEGGNGMIAQWLIRDETQSEVIGVLFAVLGMRRYQNIT